MGFFNFFGQGNINQGVEEYKATPGAVLLDVRTISATITTFILLFHLSCVSGNPTDVVHFGVSHTFQYPGCLTAAGACCQYQSESLPEECTGML